MYSKLLKLGVDMRRSLGKIRIKSSLLSIVFGALALSLTGCTSMLIHEAQWPDFTSPQPGKATCVVIRRSSNLSCNFFPIFRASEYVGGPGTTMARYFLSLSSLV